MTTTESTAGDVILWGLILIAGIALLGFAVWRVRRWSFSTPETSSEDMWSLQHLRDLHKRGEISDEEFRVLKARVIDQYRGKETRKDRASPKGTSDA
ncbi:MAG: SHOCT domain-containing protein [Phycisphaerales bacterium]|nr:SHOCT domain-containing protein [Phycisphaerales bacterium]